MNKSNIKKLWYGCQSILIAIGLLFSFSNNKPFEVGFKSSLMRNGILSTLLVILIYYLISNKNIFLKETKLSFIQWLISLFLAFNQLFRVAIQSTDNLEVIYKSIPNFITSLIILYTYIFIFNIFQVAVQFFLENNYDIKSRGRVAVLFQDHPFIFTFTVVLVCWIPIMVVNYPSILVVDAFRQLRQYYGEVPIGNAHPPIHTVLFGLSVSLGRKLGSPNLGLFISNIPQILMTLVGFSLTSLTLKKLKAPNIFLWINLFIASFSPAVLGMLMVSTKDLLFSSSLLVLYNIIILYLLLKNPSTKYKILYASCFIIMTTLVILFRKNGIYMIYPVILVFSGWLFFSLFKLAKNKKESKKKSFWIFGILVCLFLPIFLAKEVDNQLEKKYSMLDEVKKSEMLSLPFQQTARYVKEYQEEVTDEEEAIIRKVLDYDNLPKLYVPHVSDNVKRTNPIDTTTQEYKDYFKVWFEMFFKHPEVYLESTVAQNYYLFSPENTNNYYLYLENGYYKKQNVPEGDKYQEIMKKIGITPRREKEDMQNNVVRLYKVIDSIPVINLISNFSFYVIVLMVIFGISIRKKCYQTLLLSIPMVMLLGTIFAGPIIRGYVRYGLPFILVVPLLLGLLNFELKQKKKLSSAV